ncbi:hypothetical protein P167DRAFT_30504 [Morchella conica CCBAS932]|uniref:Uncharacterized protein n=1 Tax=Morchella conica CCBAS932 TaxID=1392247 RepID=A0A3N4KWT2_9PEZI|nr:hypothetical protein P167DRAFT_30504 [Morchella conica CCBAS932]
MLASRYSKYFTLYIHHASSSSAAANPQTPLEIGVHAKVHILTEASLQPLSLYYLPLMRPSFKGCSVYYGEKDREGKGKARSIALNDTTECGTWCMTRFDCVEYYSTRKYFFSLDHRGQVSEESGIWGMLLLPLPCSPLLPELYHEISHLYLTCLRKRPSPSATAYPTYPLHMHTTCPTHYLTSTSLSAARNIKRRAPPTHTWEKASPIGLHLSTYRVITILLFPISIYFSHPFCTSIAPCLPALPHYRHIGLLFRLIVRNERKKEIRNCCILHHPCHSIHPPPLLLLLSQSHNDHLPSLSTTLKDIFSYSTITSLSFSLV